MVGANENVIAGHQVHHTEKGCGGHVAGQASDNARLQINHHGVAETLRHKRDALVIGRDVGALAKVREYFNILRQMFHLVFGAACVLFLGRSYDCTQQEDREGGLHAEIVAEEKLSHPLWFAQVDPLRSESGTAETRSKSTYRSRSNARCSRGAQ